MARKPAATRAGKSSRPEPDAIDPKHRWDRPIQAPGHTQGEYWRWCPHCGHELHNEKCKLRCIC